MIKIPLISNVGAGAGTVFKQETASNTNELKTIAAGTGIVIANNASDINISSTAFPQYWTHEVFSGNLIQGEAFADWFDYHVQHGSSAVKGNADHYFDMRYCRFKNAGSDWLTMWIYPHEFIDYADPRFKIRTYWYSATGTGATQRFWVSAKVLKKTQYMNSTDAGFPARQIWTDTIYSTRLSGVNGADPSPYLKSVAFTPGIKAGDTFGPGYCLLVQIGCEDAAAQDLLISKCLIQYKTDRTFANVAEWPV